MSKLLIQEPPLQVLPSLVMATSLNEAIFLQQLHYWINVSGKKLDGNRWIYNTVDDWNKQMPWWNQRTIARIIDSLRNRGLIETSSKYNKLPMDRTLWYSINYDKVNSLTSIVTSCHDACDDDSPIMTKCHDDNDKMSECDHDNLSVPITRDYQETTTETNVHAAHGSADAQPALLPDESTQEPLNETPKPKGEKRGKKSGKPEDTPAQVEAKAITKAILDAYVEVRGANGINYGKEGAFAKKIAKDGFTAEMVKGCYEWLKADKFWEAKRVGLSTIYENLPEYKESLGKLASSAANSKPQRVVVINAFTGQREERIIT